MAASRKRGAGSSRKKKPVEEERPEVGLEYASIDEIATWPRNPKLHDLDSIEASMERHGFVLPLVRDAASTRLVAGHGRLEVLLRRRAAGKPAPDRVRFDAEGRWFVPVLTGVAFENEDEAEAYLLADNRLVEKGGWSHDDLASMVARQLEIAPDLRGLGWTAEEAAALAASLEPLPPPEPTEVSFQAFNGTEKKTVPCPKCGFHVVVE